MSSRANLSEAKVGKQVQDSTSHPADDVADNSGATSIIAHNGSKTLLPPSSLYYADGLTVNQSLSHIAIGGHIHAAFNATTNGKGFQYNRATLAAWLSDPNHPRTFIDGAQDQYKKAVIHCIAETDKFFKEENDRRTQAQALKKRCEEETSHAARD